VGFPAIDALALGRENAPNGVAVSGRGQAQYQLDILRRIDKISPTLKDLGQFGPRLCEARRRFCNVFGCVLA
jgi:hypothetical protein